ncbi:hypothetical protein RRG08_001013 [Elysia crispata]|uniref:Uncharacterized protein n=1 Tax=Elysia crispata TaxID=231223 RepID=A0AAE1AXU6_9GAST|nr:hypothetical protein RRG08_001013 [Elysia crispata]
MVLTISGEPFSKAEKEFAGVMKEPRTKIKTDTSERHHLNRLKSYSIMRMKKENFELDLYDFKPHIKRNRNKDIHNKPKNISGLVLPSELLVKPNLNPGPLKIPETQNSPKYFETNNAPHHNKSVTFDSYSELLTREEKIIAEERNIFRKKTKPIRRQEARANVNPLTTMLKHPNSEISKATLSPSFHSQFFDFSKIHRSIHSSRNRHVYVNDSHNPKRVNELTKKLVLKKRSKRNVSMAPTLQNNFSSPTTSSPDVDSNKGTLSYSPESATPDSDMARILYHNSSDLYSYLHITNNSSSNTIKSNISDSQKSIRSNKSTERIHDPNISDRVNTRLNEIGELTGYEDRLGSSNNDQPTQHTTSQDYFSNRDATTATYTSRLIAQRPGRFSSPLDTFEDILPRRTLHIGGFFELSGPYPGNGQSDLDAALLAIDHVNDQFIIPGYRLELLFNDSKAVKDTLPVLEMESQLEIDGCVQTDDTLID